MKLLAKIIPALIALVIALFLVFRTPETKTPDMRAKYGQTPSQFLDLGSGLVVHARDEGPRDAPVIMLLHGSNADLHTWEPWARALRDDYRVIRFDQVGHGLTGPDPRDDYTIDNFVRHIRLVADRLDSGRLILGGNSMGGKHALAFAAAHPERVEALVLLDASGMPQQDPQAVDGRENDDEGEATGNIGFTLAAMPGIRHLIEQFTPRRLIEKSLRQSVSVESIINDEMIDRYWELLRYPGNRRATLMRFSLPYASLELSKLAAINVPTLILWGEEDRLIPVAAARWLDNVMPESTLTIYPGVGHLPQEEHVEQSLADLRSWLAEIRR